MPLPHFGFTLDEYCSKCYKKIIKNDWFLEDDECDCGVDYISYNSLNGEYKQKTENRRNVAKEKRVFKNKKVRKNNKHLIYLKLYFLVLK